MRYSLARSCNSQRPLLKHFVQSALCSDNSSSTTCLRAMRTFSLLVDTSIPSDTGVAQEAESRRAPLISTRQTLQFPDTLKSGWLQSVGILKLSLLAASRMVVPSSTETGVLLTFRLTIYLLIMRISFVLMFV